MKKLKKSVSLFLAVVMICGAAPLGALAGLDLPRLFDMEASAVAISGTYGDNITWSFDMNTNTLVISGTGAMKDWSYYDDIPWYIYRSYITSVIIGDSVTSIGEYAFNDFDILTSVTIGNSVTSIGPGAFIYCESLTSVTIPNSVTSIGPNAFKDCSSLASATIPNSVTNIGHNAFKNCISLTSVTIPDSVTSIGEEAFRNCKILTSVSIGISIKNIDNYAFAQCDSLTDVYYNGSKEEWKKISFGGANECLTGAVIHYNYQSHSHSYTSRVTKSATCTETGIRTYTCSCGDSYTSVISVISHTLGNWEVLTPASCTKTGERVRKCSSCKNIIERETISKTEHILGNWEIVVQPTEEKTGLKVRRCTVCKNVIEDQIIPKLHASIAIQNYPTTVFYKDTATIYVIGENIPSDAKINWSVSGGNVELTPSTDSKSCSIRFLKTGNIKITATIDGTTISDTVTVTVKYTWWQWILVIVLFGWIWY